MPVKSATKASVARNRSVPPPEPKLGLVAVVKGRKRKLADLSDVDESSEDEQKPVRKRGRRSLSAIEHTIPTNDTKQRSARTSISAVGETIEHATLQPATHPRPSRRLFIFGSGNFGQLGLGTLVCLLSHLNRDAHSRHY